MSDMTIETIFPQTLPARVFAELGLADAVAEDESKNQRWIPLVPLGKWDHPQYGNLEITPATIQRMHDNHEVGLPGIELPIDIDHSYGGSSEAAGWLVSTEVRADGLWGLVEFNDWGMELVESKRFRYISPEWFPKWKDPQTGKHYEDVLTSIALTNRPFFKDLPALLASTTDRGRTYVAYQFAWEQKGEEIWHRIRDPKDFRPDTMRSKDMPGIKGVRMILGKLKPENVAKDGDPDAMVLQALRFDKETWTVEKAKEWIGKHPNIRKAAADVAAEDIRRMAADQTGDTHMPDVTPNPNPIANPDTAPKPDPGATSTTGADSGAGAISMAEFQAVKARAEAAEKSAIEANKAAGAAQAELDRTKVRGVISALRFGDDKRRAIAPAMVDVLTDTAMRFTAGEERDKHLKSLEGLSFVELGERGDGGSDAAGGTANEKLDAAIKVKMAATKDLGYGDAMQMVAKEQPGLIQARDAEIRGAQPVLRGK